MKSYRALEQINPPVPGTLVVWHKPGDRTFYVTVRSPEQAQDVMAILNDYDTCVNPSAQENCGSSGLLIFKDKSWKEWYHDTGFDIHEWQPGKVM